jgi:hypothetical protein
LIDALPILQPLASAPGPAPTTLHTGVGYGDFAALPDR